MASIQMKRGLKSAYTALASKSADTLYFLTDTGEIFLGDIPMSVTDLSGYVVKDGSKVLSTNDFTNAYKSKIDNLTIFSTISAGGKSIEAESSDDTLSFVDGSNITIVADPEGDKITISAKDTTYTLVKSGSTIQLKDNSGSVVSEITDANTTYSAATQSSSGLMSAADKKKLDGIADGATKNTDYTLPTASATQLGGVKVGAGLKISDGVLSSTSADLSGVTSSAADLNLLKGAANAGVTVNNVQALSGVESNIQTQLDGKSDAEHTHSAYNVNSFGKVKVGNSTINSDTLGDTLNITAGTGITLNTNDTSDTLTIGVDSGITGSILLESDLKRNTDGEITHTNTVTAGTASSSTGTKTVSAAGGTINIPSITYDGNGHIKSKSSTTVTLSETPLTVTQVDNETNIDGEHSEAFSVVTGVVKGTGSHDISVTTTEVTLPPQYVLPAASSSTRGGVKVGFTASGAKVPVQVSSEQMYVELTDSAISAGGGITKIVAGKGLTEDAESGTATLNIGAGTGISVTDDAVALAASGVTAGSYGPSANATPAYGATFNVPYFTVDDYGRVTSASTKTVKIPASDDTNTAHSHSAGNGLTISGSGGTSGTTTYSAKAGSGITVTADGINANTSYTTSGKNYKVAVDSTSGGLYVNVPWTDTVYTHPSYTAKSSGLYKVTVDSTGHVSAVTAVTKADITGLGIPGQDTNTTYSAGTGITLSGTTFSVKTGYTTSGKNYAVKSHTDGNLYVNVPWTDTVYTHPSYTAKSSGLYKVTVDATGHVSAATAVAKSDITGLGIPGQDTTYSAGTGITLSGTTFSNAGVRSITASDGTLTVNTGGTNSTIDVLTWGSF